MDWRKPLPMFLLKSLVMAVLALLTMIHSAPIWYVTRFVFLVAVVVEIFGAGFIVYRKIRQKTDVLLKRFLGMIAPVAVSLLLACFSLTMFAITTVKIGQYGMTPKSEMEAVHQSSEGFIDYRGQIHVHSYLSSDASSDSSFEKIAQAAKSAGVSWIILTDHIDHLPDGNYPDNVNGVIFIYGIEEDWKKEKSSIFRASLKDRTPKLNLHGHIEDFGRSGNPEWRSWDAIELVNFHANSFKKPGSILWRALFDPRHLYQALTDVLPQNFQYWQSLAEREQRPIPIFAGPDAHQNVGILGVQVDPYDLMLSLVSTHIWLRDWETLNQYSIFEAIKRGRTYISFDYLGDPTGFQFWAESGSGKKNFTGDMAEKPWILEIALPNSLLIENGGFGKMYNVRGIEVKFYHNNSLIEGALSCAITNPQPGFWRVEIWKDGNPWIISGQILVK